jgi:hypothetical protein
MAQRVIRLSVDVDIQEKEIIVSCLRVELKVVVCAVSGYRKFCSVRETRGHQLAVLVIELVDSSTEGLLLEVNSELRATSL